MYLDNELVHLDFNALDDMASLVDANRALPPNLSIQPRHFGPLVEFEWLRSDRPGCLPDLSQLLQTKRLHLLQRVLSGRATAKLTDTEHRAAMASIRWSAEQEPDEWFFFCADMQAAAEFSGFTRRIAQQLVAALREMASNIFEHSGAPETGLLGYAAVQNEFEFIVADRGIGVLRSLQTSQEFRLLCDSGEALRIALTDGASRYGSVSGHGGGFRPLFRGLINLDSSLRFRSGDHALTIDGRSPTLARALIRQKVQLPGFVISAVCFA